MAEHKKTYRLVTRSDFDGLVSAMLLKSKGIIDEIKFVHPKDVQDGLVEITSNDITTNLPYCEGVHLAFDHHYSETVRTGDKENYINDPNADSTATVVYNYYGGIKAFPRINEEIIAAVDKADSAKFTKEEVLNPAGWVLLNFLMDPRTGLGRFKYFNLSNYQLMMMLIDYCGKHTVSEILEIPEVKARVDLYFEQQDDFQEQIKRCSKIHGNALVVDLRSEEIIYSGNRFVKYALFPECNISIQVIWGLNKQNTVLNVGKSIFNKTSNVNIGALMLKYGGGGHPAAGACQVPNDQSDQILQGLIPLIS